MGVAESETLPFEGDAPKHDVCSCEGGEYGLLYRVSCEGGRETSEILAARGKLVVIRRERDDRLGKYPLFLMMLLLLYYVLLLWGAILCI